jgi:hypothetical protein
MPREPTDAEIKELLDAPETPKETAALDKVVADPEEVLRRARAKKREPEPMIDYEEERRFTRAQLDAMPVLEKGQVLNDWIVGDGERIVVDLLRSERLFVQYDRKHQIYRCAGRKPGEVTAFEPDWRIPKP